EALVAGEICLGFIPRGRRLGIDGCGGLRTRSLTSRGTRAAVDHFRLGLRSVVLLISCLLLRCHVLLLTHLPPAPNQLASLASRSEAAWLTSRRRATTCP